MEEHFSYLSYGRKNGSYMIAEIKYKNIEVSGI